MKKLTAYIIKEHIPPFFFALALLMFIFLMNFLVKYITQIFGKGLPFVTIIELIFYNLAWMFALAVPMAVLIATLMSFGRLSGDNEITILKSSGISIYRIMLPAIWFAIVITFLMIIFNDRILPDFNHRARVMFSNIREKKPTLNLEPGIFFSVGKYSFLAEHIEKTDGAEPSERTNVLGPEYQTETRPDKLRNVIIFDRGNPNKTVTVTAEEGYMVYSSARKSLLFTLFDGEYHEYDNENPEEYRLSHFSRNMVVVEAPEFELEDKEDDYRGDREMNVEMMLEKVDESEKLLAEETEKVATNLDEHWSELMAEVGDIAPALIDSTADSAMFAITNDQYRDAQMQALRKVSRLYQLLRTTRSRIDSYSQAINKYLVEVHKKFSIPFSSLVFILIGAPLGIAARRGSLGVGASLSIAFFILYWACLILGEDLADREFLSPFWSMWFPNILIGLAGMYLSWRAVKETTMIKWGRLIGWFRKFGKSGIPATTEDA